MSAAALASPRRLRSTSTYPRAASPVDDARRRCSSAYYRMPTHHSPILSRRTRDQEAFAWDSPDGALVLVDGLYCPTSEYIPFVLDPPEGGRGGGDGASRFSRPLLGDWLPRAEPPKDSLPRRPKAIRRAVNGAASWCALCGAAFGGPTRRLRCPACGATCCARCCCGPLAVLPSSRPCYPCRACLVRGGPAALAWSWSDFGLYEDRLFESIPSRSQVARMQATFPSCVNCCHELTGWRRTFCHICLLPMCKPCLRRERRPSTAAAICDSCAAGTDLMRHPTSLDMRATNCAVCRRRFTFYRGRSRCRHCGDTVCPACTSPNTAPTSCACRRCARPALLRLSDDVLRHAVGFCTLADRGTVLGVCRRLQLLVVLPFPAIERLEDYYDVDWTEDLLGEGAFGKVYSCVCRRTQRQCAVKIIPLDKITSAAKTAVLMREIQIHQQLSHPHTVPLFETLQNDEALFMVMGLGGDSVLSDLMLCRGRLREWQAASIVLQVLEFLRYLHDERHVVHRDLKPDNLVLCAADSRGEGGNRRGARRADPHVRVIDFGLARDIGPAPALAVPDEDFLRRLEAPRGLSALQVAKHPELLFRCTPCGTLRYCAPEVVAAGSSDRPVYHGNIPKRDVWSVGILAFLMLSGRLPHKGNRLKELQAEMRRPVSLAGRRWDSVSAEGRMFIQWVCALDPFQRPTAAEAMNHAWFQRMVPLAPTCLRHCLCVAHCQAPTEPSTPKSNESPSVWNEILRRARRLSASLRPPPGDAPNPKDLVPERPVRRTRSRSPTKSPRMAHLPRRSVSQGSAATDVPRCTRCTS